jgi:hypothetical protein
MQLDFINSSFELGFPNYVGFGKSREKPLYLHI